MRTHTHTHTHTSEHSDNRGKAAALKKLIQHVLNGERLPSLLMTIIRFVLPCNDHQIKKLLLIFWEIWPKTSPDGKLLHEMILVCDAYRKVREGGREERGVSWKKERKGIDCSAAIRLKVSLFRNDFS